jgi:hypothetical protein
MGHPLGFGRPVAQWPGVTHLARGTLARVGSIDIYRPAQVVVQGGAFGEHRVDEAEVEVVEGTDYPGGLIEFAAPEVHTTTSRIVVGDNRLTVDLPPRSRIRLTLHLTLRALPPRHQSIS